MTLLPPRFLFRVAYPCRYVREVPREEDDRLLDLPPECVLEHGAEKPFAELRLAWNEQGLAAQLTVRGKEQLPQGSASRLKGSDGLTLWLDTRDARASHRASKYCHQFHLLPTGGGPEGDEPVFGQSKINRALQDAAFANASEVPFRSHSTPGGYVLEAFFPAAALHGFDPEQHPRLGFYYAVHDAELGDQVLSVGADFPYWEDPSLWSALDLQAH